MTLVLPRALDVDRDKYQVQGRTKGGYGNDVADWNAAVRPRSEGLECLQVQLCDSFSRDTRIKDNSIGNVETQLLLPILDFRLSLIHSQVIQRPHAPR